MKMHALDLAVFPSDNLILTLTVDPLHDGAHAIANGNGLSFTTRVRSLLKCLGATRAQAIARTALGARHQLELSSWR